MYNVAVFYLRGTDILYIIYNVSTHLPPCRTAGRPPPKRLALIPEAPNAFFGRAWLFFRKSLTLFSEEPHAFFRRAWLLFRKSTLCFAARPADVVLTELSPILRDFWCIITPQICILKEKRADKLFFFEFFIALRGDLCTFADILTINDSFYHGKSR